MKPFHLTGFVQDLLERVARGQDAKIVIDARDAELGVGKTNSMVALAIYLAYLFGYDELSTRDFTLSGQEYLRRYREHPPDRPTVLGLDELVGGGTGDARRSMSNKSVQMSHQWQVMRTRQVVTITTLADSGDADKRLMKYANYRLWHQPKPIGTFIPYALGTAFKPEDDEIKHRRLDKRIQMPEITDTELYRDLADKKNHFINSSAEDADDLHDDYEVPDNVVSEISEEARRETLLEIAQEKRNEGKTVREIADIVGRGKTWVSDHTEAPKAT